MTGPSKVNRPLSPHLMIYKPQMTSVLSILHRITGIGLVLGLILLIFWFSALSLGPEPFGKIDAFYASVTVRILLAGSVWALWYHTFAGLRHLIWDFGYGLNPKWINPSAYMVLAGSLFFTIGTLSLSWII